MTNTQPLAGRVAIITGASRGIGKALALRLAREGADIVVAAKSEASTEKLPGSIYSVAEEIEQLGRKALAVKTDVRDDDSVKAMVDKTIDTFGRVDILINNAGAMWWHPLLDTPPKRFDLVMGVNVRGSYLCAYHVLPHMQRQKWGHIMMFSPSLRTTPMPNKIIYMISKQGMTELAQGIAEEFRDDNIAANALWPVTLIESQATINAGLGTREQWRSPEILCDAAMVMLSQEPSACTGRAVTDEEILRENGVTDFSKYWLEGEPEVVMKIDGSQPFLW